MKRNILAIGIIFLFILSALTPIVFGYNVRISNENEIKSTASRDGGLMDSAWPMYCHDTRHTGQSQYSTAGNPIQDKWWFKVPHTITRFDYPNFINIANDGTIYLTCYGGYIYALYPNGTLKWILDKSVVNGTIRCHPAIDENGTIYFGTRLGDFYAINPNGTIKWKYISSSPLFFSSPAIGDNGIIYFMGDYLYALYPNGTIKWRYELINTELYSSPAIADDGTIYCCGYGHLYSIYPNGTLKWKVELQDWIPNSPSIAEDGTVYISSYSGILYALDPNNGNIKWEYPIGCELFYANPSLGVDGTIYLFGFDETDECYYFYAVNPDGTKRGTSKLNTDFEIIEPSDPMISADGTIYVAGGYCFYAFQRNGIERWCKIFDIPFYFVSTSPVIGEDGTIYLGLVHYTEREEWEYDTTLFLHAYNVREPDAPSAPEITGPISGIPDMNYNYTIVSTDPNGEDIYYYVCWGEPTVYVPMLGWHFSQLEEFGPYPSGEEITLNYTWSWRDDFTIKVIAKDTNNLLSKWSKLTVTIPRNRASYSSYLLRFLEHLCLVRQRYF